MGHQLTGLKFKKQYGNEFYKILNEDLLHNNFQYVEGENIDPEFISSCSSEGLYFTDLDDIYNFLLCGKKICKVIIDDDSIVYVRDHWDDDLGDSNERRNYKANKITIKNFSV